ncbi:MAG: extracellular solute-binding protein [Lachnospiraceae bacterium]|nr:extracellular solute-binding protein [Lachnospiraceae bacterium]
MKSWRKYMLTLGACIILNLCACNSINQKEYKETEVNTGEDICYVTDAVNAKNGSLQIAGMDESKSQIGIWESEDKKAAWKKVLDLSEVLKNKDTVEDVFIDLTENEEGLITVWYPDSIQIYYFNFDGMVKPLESDVVEKIKDSGVTAIEYISDNMAFGVTMEEEKYLVDIISGDMKKTDLSKERMLSYCVTEKQIYALTEQGIKSCDIAGKVENLEGEAVRNLKDYLKKESLGWNTGFSVFFREGNPIIYIADEQQIVKFEGNKIQTIIKKIKTSIGGEDTSLQKFVMTDDDRVIMLAQKEEHSILAEFELVNTKNNKKTLKIYALENDLSFQQIVQMYQKKNPGVDVVLEIGMEDENTKREDAIMLLNSSLVSNSGPDIILLDGLPYEKYMEQGLLEDMSSFASSQAADKNLFENVLCTYRVDDRQYGIPLFFSMMNITSLKKIGDVDAIQDFLAYIDLCAQNGDVPVYEKWSYDQVVSMLYRLYVTDFVKETDVPDSGKIAEFYAAVNRIYALEDMKEVEEAGKGFDNISLLPSGYGNFDFVITGEFQTALDYICYFEDLKKLEALRQNNFENKLLEKEGKIVCVPMLSLGILKKNTDDELAKDFISYALSDDVQQEVEYSGLSVSRDIMREKLEGLASETIEIRTESGETRELEFSKLSDDGIQKWMEDLEHAICVTGEDHQIFRIIMGEVPAVAKGRQSEEEAAKEACRKINLYLNE